MLECSVSKLLGTGAGLRDQVGAAAEGLRRPREDDSAEYHQGQSQLHSVQLWICHGNSGRKG